MSLPPQRPAGGADPVATAQALTGALNELTGQLAATVRYGHRNRHLIVGLAVSLVVDVALTVALAVVAVQARDATDAAARVHDRQVATCESGNDARAAQIQLWNYLLSVPPVRPLTAEQKQQITQFRAYVHRVFAARDCSRA